MQMKTFGTFGQARKAAERIAKRLGFSVVDCRRDEFR